MEQNTTHHALQKPLIISIDNAGLVTMFFTGDITHDVMDDYKSELEKGAKLIEEYYQAHTRKVRVILDIRNFTGNYSLEALNALVGFARKNTPYVDRTASFGGSDKVKMAGEVAIALSMRDNIKIFDTKEEAMTWLG